MSFVQATEPPREDAATIDWESISDMANLMFLVYEYMGDWGVESFTNMLATLEATKADEVSEREMTMLRGLQAKYPRAEVLDYFTNSAGLQCVVGRNPKKKHVTVVFRGTDSFMDCLYDLFVVKKSLGGGVKVHRGFYNQLFYNGVFDKLKALLAAQLESNPGWGVYISGHSLGASLATLSAYLLGQAFPAVRFDVFAFASPKCGNARFKQAFHALANVRMFRICYGRDCVTAFPTFWYSHVGHNLWYDKDTRTWHYYDRDVKNDYYLCSYFNAFDHLGHKYLEAVKSAYGKQDCRVEFHMP